MIKDPLTCWDGLFPYDALAPVGVTPQSSQQQILDASFDLMAQGLMTPEVRAAWDELRIRKRRLLVDFFLHQTDFSAEWKQICQTLEERQQCLDAPPEPPCYGETATTD